MWRWACVSGGLLPTADIDGGLTLRRAEVAENGPESAGGMCSNGLDAGRWWAMAGLKGSGRALEKTIRCYGEDASRLCDVVRQVRVRTRALLRARGAARRHGGWPGGGIEQTLLLAAVLVSRGGTRMSAGHAPPPAHCAEMRVCAPFRARLCNTAHVRYS